MASFVEHIIAKRDLQMTGVLLEIWDIADTPNAFYQAIDYFYHEADIPPVVPPAPPTDGCYDRDVLLSVGYARSLCDCHKFYQLVYGAVAVLMECQIPLVFDPTSNTCNWRDLVDISGVQHCA